MKLSKRVDAMQFSPIRRFNPIAAKAEKDGVKVYKLNIGQPDVQTPKCFLEAVKNFDETIIAYDKSQGNDLLIDAIRGYFKNNYSIDYDYEDINITMGGSEALIFTFLTILENDDEVIIPEPFYTNYNTFVGTAGAIIRPVVTHSEDGYHYASREKICPKINEHTKALVCVNPNNPTGRVLTADEMETMADIAIENDLWIISDEVYREYVYDGDYARSFASIDRIQDRLILVDSVSKRFSACGARVGFIASKNEEFMQGILKLSQGRLCVPTIDQIGAAELFKLPKEYFENSREEYCGRRDAAYDEIMKIPGVVCHKPSGGFYMTVDLPVEDTEDFLMFLLEEYRDNNETVMFAPASGFYATKGCGKPEIRIAYVLNKHDMRRAAELIKKGLEAYKKTRE